MFFPIYWFGKWEFYFSSNYLGNFHLIMSIHICQVLKLIRILTLFPEYYKDLQIISIYFHHVRSVDENCNCVKERLTISHGMQ